MIGGSMRNFLIVLITLVFGIISDVALAKDDFCIAFTNYLNTTVYVYAGKNQFINMHVVDTNETVTLSRADMKIACDRTYGNKCAVTVFIPSEGKLDVIAHHSLIPGIQIGYFNYNKYNWVGEKVPCVS
jgi:hypothetical protein